MTGMDISESAPLIRYYRHHSRNGVVTPSMLAHLVLFQKMFHDELMTNCGRWLCCGAEDGMTGLHAFVEECHEAIRDGEFILEQCLEYQSWADQQNLNLRVAFPEEMHQSLVIGLGVWFGFTEKVVMYAECTEVHVISDRD